LIFLNLITKEVWIPVSSVVYLGYKKKREKMVLTILILIFGDVLIRFINLLLLDTEVKNSDDYLEDYNYLED